jgi:hypothetical protein
MYSSQKFGRSVVSTQSQEGRAFWARIQPQKSILCVSTGRSKCHAASCQKSRACMQTSLSWPGAWMLTETLPIPKGGTRERHFAIYSAHVWEFSRSLVRVTRLTLLELPPRPPRPQNDGFTIDQWLQRVFPSVDEEYEPVDYRFVDWNNKYALWRGHEDVIENPSYSSSYFRL